MTATAKTAGELAAGDVLIVARPSGGATLHPIELVRSSRHDCKGQVHVKAGDRVFTFRTETRVRVVLD